MNIKHNRYKHLDRHNQTHSRYLSRPLFDKSFKIVMRIDFDFDNFHY